MGQFAQGANGRAGVIQGCVPVAAAGGARGHVAATELSQRKYVARRRIRPAADVSSSKAGERADVGEVAMRCVHLVSAGRPVTAAGRVGRLGNAAPETV